MQLLQLLLAQVPEDPASLASDLVGAFQSRRWTALAGLVLAVLIQAADKLDVLQHVSGPWKRWAAVGIATVISVSGGLILGLGVPAIIGTAVSIALGAIGSYELLLKRFDKQPPTP